MFDSQQQVALAQLFFLQSLFNEQKEEQVMNEKNSKASESKPAPAPKPKPREREASPWPEHRRFWHRRDWRKTEHRAPEGDESESEGAQVVF